MKKRLLKYGYVLLVMPAMMLITPALTNAQEEKTGKAGDKEEKVVKVSIQKKKAVKTSYAPVTITESFEDTMARMKAAKPEVMKRHMDLLNERYDLSDNPAKGVTMSRGKSIQQGVRIKLPKDVTWEPVEDMTQEDTREKVFSQKVFLPLPHPNHAEGGMIFPKFHIDEIKK